MIKKIVVLFLVFISSSFLANAEVSNLIFTTDAQTIKPNQVSETITVQAQDPSGKITQTSCLHLETTSATGQFSSNATNWESVGNLTMSKNTANKNFYYKDSTPGNYILIIKFAPTNCSSWASEQLRAEQNIIVSDSQTTNQVQEAAVTETIFGVQTASGEASIIEPQIFASAGPDKIIIVGADEKFTGSSVGLNKEPLGKARYLWSFGDGSITEGINVLHNYKYPGEYIVVLDVASGEYSASDRLIVKVIPNQLKISEVTSEFIKLLNESASEINISNWLLGFNGAYFKIPETTLIRAKSELIIPNSISGLKTSGKNDFVDLLYPNASVAYSYNGVAKAFLGVGEPIKTQQAVLSSAKAKESEAPNEAEQIQDLASVVYAEQKSERGVNDWLLPTAGIGLLAAIGYASVKKQKQKEEPVPERASEEFFIEEDKF